MPLTSAAEAPPPPDQDDEVEAAERSLVEDLKELFDDGRALLSAEFAFQKARAIFAADAFRSIALLGAVAALLAVLALMGLTVGLIIALTPHLTAWGATALVVGALLVAAVLSVRAAARRWRQMAAGLSGERPGS